MACAPPVIVPELPMRFAYADPPYIDCARRYYHCDEVDHVKLIERLADGWPDGWALSLSSESLPQIIRMIPASLDPRVGVWHKGSRAGVCYGERDAYEPLIVVGGRRRRLEVGDQLDNVLTWAATGRPHSHPDALIGMKSPAFCEWMFRRLGAARHDVLDDLFPGSGAVARAWSDWTRDPSRVDARTRRPSRFEAAQIGDRRR